MKPLAQLHSTENAQTVADDHVQQDAVPPALLEVGQNVGEENLKCENRKFTFIGTECYLSYLKPLSS